MPWLWPAPKLRVLVALKRTRNCCEKLAGQTPPNSSRGAVPISVALPRQRWYPLIAGSSLPVRMVPFALMGWTSSGRTNEQLRSMISSVVRMATRSPGPASSPLGA